MKGIVLYGMHMPESFYETAVGITVETVARHKHPVVFDTHIAEKFRKIRRRARFERIRMKDIHRNFFLCRNKTGKKYAIEEYYVFIEIHLILSNRHR